MDVQQILGYVDEFLREMVESFSWEGEEEARQTAEDEGREFTPWECGECGTNAHTYEEARNLRVLVALASGLIREKV